MLPELDQFEAVVGQAIDFEFDGDRLPARIDEVKAMRQQHGEDRQPFSVVFVTESADVLDQQIVTLRHESLGTFALFLVPLGPKGSGVAYEAVFT